jgi:hypothetical protein
MDPMEATTDRTTFESELELLLSTPATSSPSRKRPAVAGPLPAHHITANSDGASSKRIKADPALENGPSTPGNDMPNFHPARLLLLDASQTRAQIRPPLGPRRARQGHQGQTWRTLTNTIRRQWDPRKDDLDYEFLLEQRRRERVSNVDRYVPGNVLGRPRKAKTVFPLQQLPEDIRTRLFEYILVSADPISIDFYWLRSFVRGHARVPIVMQSMDVNGSTYTFPMGWNQVLNEVQTMKDEMGQFKQVRYSWV